MIKNTQVIVFFSIITYVSISSAYAATPHIAESPSTTPTTSYTHQNNLIHRVGWREFYESRQYKKQQKQPELSNKAETNKEHTENPTANASTTVQSETNVKKPPKIIDKDITKIQQTAPQKKYNSQPLPQQSPVNKKVINKILTNKKEHLSAKPKKSLYDTNNITEKKLEKKIPNNNQDNTSEEKNNQHQQHNQSDSPTHNNKQVTETKENNKPAEESSNKEQIKLDADQDDLTKAQNTDTQAQLSATQDSYTDIYQDNSSNNQVVSKKTPKKTPRSFLAYLQVQFGIGGMSIEPIQNNISVTNLKSMTNQSGQWQFSYGGAVGFYNKSQRWMNPGIELGFYSYPKMNQSLSTTNHSSSVSYQGYLIDLLFSMRFPNNTKWQVIPKFGLGYIEQKTTLNAPNPQNINQQQQLKQRRINAILGLSAQFNYSSTIAVSLNYTYAFGHKPQALSPATTISQINSINHVAPIQLCLLGIEYTFK